MIIFTPVNTWIKSHTRNKACTYHHAAHNTQHVCMHVHDSSTITAHHMRSHVDAHCVIFNGTVAAGERTYWGLPNNWDWANGFQRFSSSKLVQNPLKTVGPVPIILQSAVLTVSLLNHTQTYLSAYTYANMIYTHVHVHVNLFQASQTNLSQSVTLEYYIRKHNTHSWILHTQTYTTILSFS